MSIVVIAAVGFGIWYVNRATGFTGYKVTYTKTVSVESSEQYEPYKKGYIRYDRDGAEAVGGDGALLWNVPYSMVSPIISVCGDYAAFADKNTRQVYITDDSGVIYPITVLYPIQEIEVAKQGVIAVRMNEGTDDYIYVLDKDGNLLVDIKTQELKDGFPVYIALSQDGQKLVTAYLVIEGDSISNWVTFYNFGNVGQSYVNKLVGVYKYDTAVAEVCFINNNTVCAFRENGPVIYSMKELPEVQKELTFSQEIYNVFYNEEYVGVAYSISSNNVSKQVQLYTSTGELIFDKTVANGFSKIILAGENIVTYGHSVFEIWKPDGTKLVSTVFDESVETVYNVNTSDEFILIEEDAVKTIKLTTDKEESK